LGLGSEIVFPRASAIGYHRFHVIRQIHGNWYEGGSACPKTMSVDSPKAQITGGKAAKISQRVEDNAFHLVRRALTNVKFPPAKPHTPLRSWQAFI
jgi:hypothetical protein